MLSIFNQLKPIIQHLITQCYFAISEKHIQNSSYMRRVGADPSDTLFTSKMIPMYESCTKAIRICAR